MPKQKETPILKRFYPYMGRKKALLPLALFLSGLSAALSILPFVLIWYITRSILGDPQSIDLPSIGTYAWYAFAFAFAGILIYFSALMSSHLAAFRCEVGMQKKGMQKIISMPLGFFNQYASGKLRKIVNDGAGTTHTFLAHQLPDMAGSVVSPVILIALVFWVDWRMGLVAMIPIILAFITMSFMMTSQGKSFQKRYFDALEEMSSESVEYVRGIPVVKTFGQSIYSFKRFYASIIRYKDMVLAYTLLWRKSMSLYLVLMQSATFFLVPAAILLIGRGDQLAVVLADFIFYLLISPLFSLLLMRSMYFRQNAMIAKQAIDRLEGLFAYPAMHFPEAPAALRDHSLEFRNVSFSYSGSAARAVDGVSFALHEGETIALVGASGGGKTTVARLAARFWNAGNGSVLIGGVNVKEIPKQQLMNTISFVFQNTRLLKGTLRENIVFGTQNVSQADIDRAVEYSQSREIITNLPDGLDTVIGTQGTYLSGGEQQRIVLARAFLKNAPIVLLDEATAFADPENEHLIQKALRELSRGKTTLMIAHRLTTVRSVDRILVVADGKIAEMGTHDELYAKGGLYHTMWDEYQQSVAWEIAGSAAAEEGMQYA